jgi:excisionase family DNA binding protein
MTAPAAERHYLSTKETAEVLGCSARSVFRLIDAGRLTPVQFRPNGRLRFPTDQVDALMEPRKAAA